MGLVHHPNVVSDGLKYCWDAGNRRSYPGAGTTWTDPVGGIKGTLENEDDDALSFNSSKGGYFEFDGTDGRVDCGDSLIVGWPEVSVCVWAWMEPNQNCPKLVSIGHAGAFDMAACLNDDHSVADGNWFFCYTGGGYIATPAGSIIPYLGKWTHWVVTNRSGNRRLYIDGELSAEDASGGTIGAAAYNMCFGNREDGNRPLEGNMASVYIYNRALSADEVSQNYESLKPRFVPRIAKSGMLANWDAGDPASYVGGTTWKDTANHYDGTLENDDDGSLTFDSANGGSLVFDGTDDYVGPIAIGDHSSTARSVIIWAAADSYAQSNNDEFSVFNSASDKFSASLGLSNHYGYFYFKSKMTHTSAYQWGIASTSLVAGSWHCWAVTINASDEIVAIYQDGESKTSAANNGLHLKDDTYIGCRMQSGSVQYPWAGKIGTVRLYTKTLSAAEVMDNYQKTKARFGH